MANKYLRFEPNIYCRINADKFAFLIPASELNSKNSNDFIAAASIPECLSNPISFRFGRFFVNDINIPVSTMIDRAALAEKSISNHFGMLYATYDDNMRKELIHEQKIVNEMRGALINNEFEPWFQPQYNHNTGELIGAEALVRWKKNGKIVPPNDFVPIFERNGFIYEMDKFIWERVAQIIAKWIKEGRNPVPISVNVSRFDIFQEGCNSFIINLIKKYDIPVHLFRIEITESAFAATSSTIFSKIKELKDFGFDIEIDDFGSGYSSLNVLKDVPASILKLDMRFFDNTADSSRAGTIIQFAVRLAKWLNMDVIAEGVETRTQADYLKSIGCFYIQGYYYSKPLPLEEYESLGKISKKRRVFTGFTCVNSEKAVSVLDPNSFDTWLFNNYAEPSCILEYENNKIEIVRANEKCVRRLSNNLSNIRDFIKLNFFDHLDEINSQKMKNNLALLIEKDEVVDEYKFSNIPGQTDTISLIISMRLISSLNNSYLIYCAFKKRK